MTPPPLKALSIMQPWAWLIAHGHKPVENRGWPCHVRGRILVHAGQRIDDDAAEDLRAGRHPVTGAALRLDLPEAWETGGVVGEAEIHGCLTGSPDPWFVGPFGILLRDARPLPFRPCRGRLGFFVPSFSPDDPPRPLTARPPDLFTSRGTEV